MEGKNSNPVETNEKDYLSEIERLKENSVSKEDYQKLLEENRKLIQTVPFRYVLLRFGALFH